MSDIAITTNTRPDRAAVASQWQLIWWAFKRHRLAMAALFVTIAMYIVALLPFLRHQRSGSAECARHLPSAATCAFHRYDGRPLAWSALLSAEADA